MQPAAPEIERYCLTDAGRPSPSAEPPPALHDQAVDAPVGEPPPRGDTGCAATDDRHFGIPVGSHAVFHE